MAVGDTEGPGVRLRETPPTNGDRIRDFDQLDGDETRAFLRLYRGEQAEPTIDPGTVISFTDYYRVERR
ncbi:MAG: hypothetical protein V5A23_03260 [Halobacteriales archaeon]